MTFKKNGTRSKSSSQSNPEMLLGVSLTQPRVGFGQQENGPAEVGEIISYAGPAHLCTVAPTRSGKGTGVIIPNLLTYPGPVIVFDPKGENYHVTARRRREMGQTVVKLDPFGVVDDSTDSFNPLDLFDLPGGDLEADSQSLAELLSRDIRGRKEPFWDINGTAFSSGLIALAATQGEAEKKDLASVYESLTSSDVVYNMAVVLDTIGKSISPLANREIAAVLQMPDITRGGVIATTNTYYKPFGAERVLRCLKSSTFSLQSVVDGDPLSIYLILPPHRIHSHRGLLKLWVGALLMAIFTRRSPPKLRTLFLLDEAAQLGNFPLLESLLTLAAGYGVWVHSFWQDLAQIKSCYPDSWQTLLNNCAVLQTFGCYNRAMATQWGDYLDHGPHDLRTLKPDEQILSIHGAGEHRCRRLNYLRDPQFAGLFDPNPLHHPPTRRSKPTQPKPSSPILGK